MTLVQPQPSTQRQLLEEWHSACFDVPVDDKVLIADRWLNSMLGLQNVDDVSQIEFIRDPETGEADKAVITSKALHRLQFLAIQGILRTFPDAIAPEDVVKSLLQAVEPVPVAQSSLGSDFPAVKPREHTPLSSVIVSGIQLTVTHVPFLIGSNPSVCHFPITPDLVSDNSLIAGVHCVFDRKDGWWVVENVSDSGAVVVDGMCLDAKASVEVKPGSTVIVGEGTLSFTFFPRF